MVVFLPLVLSSASHADRLGVLSIGQVEATGLDCEGIYRIPGKSSGATQGTEFGSNFSRVGKLATVQKIVHNIEKDEATFEFDPREDPAAVAGVLKVRLTCSNQPYQLV